VPLLVAETETGAGLFFCLSSDPSIPALRRRFVRVSDRSIRVISLTDRARPGPYYIPTFHAAGSMFMDGIAASSMAREWFGMNIQEEVMIMSRRSC
jgi:hypothetical protein